MARVEIKFFVTLIFQVYIKPISLPTIALSQPRSFERRPQPPTTLNLVRTPQTAKIDRKFLAAVDQRRGSPQIWLHLKLRYKLVHDQRAIHERQSQSLPKPDETCNRA